MLLFLQAVSGRNLPESVAIIEKALPYLLCDGSDKTKKLRCHASEFSLELLAGLEPAAC